LDNAQAWGATALNIFACPLLWANRQLIMDRAIVLRLPTMHVFPEEAEEGSFAAYGPRLRQLFVEIMPQQIIKLFQGEKVADWCDGHPGTITASGQADRIARVTSASGLPHTFGRNRCTATLR